MTSMTTHIKKTCIETKILRLKWFVTRILTINCPPKLNNFFTHKNSIYLEASKIVKTHHNQTNTQNNHEQKIMMVCV